jgi:hypothetical protein
MDSKRKMPYGEVDGWFIASALSPDFPTTVRLGNSGLKVSKIILGTMQYGDKTWGEWLLDKEEAIKHIKIASVLRLRTHFVYTCDPRF